MVAEVEAQGVAVTPEIEEEEQVEIIAHLLLLAHRVHPLLQFRPPPVDHRSGQLQVETP